MKAKLFFIILFISASNFLFAQEEGDSIVTTPPTEENANENLDKNAADASVYKVVEQNATFQGGDLLAFRAWVGKQVKYPKESVKKREEGRVMITFVVSETGEIFKIDIQKSSAFEKLDDEAVRVILSSPKWEPAMQDGIKVSQEFTIPIDFRLTKTKDY